MQLRRVQRLVVLTVIALAAGTHCRHTNTVVVPAGNIHTHARADPGAAPIKMERERGLRRAAAEVMRYYFTELTSYQVH